MLRLVRDSYAVVVLWSAHIFDFCEEAPTLTVVDSSNDQPTTNDQIFWWYNLASTDSIL